MNFYTDFCVINYTIYIIDLQCSYNILIFNNFNDNIATILSKIRNIS